MKKILLIINEYLSQFFSVVLVGAIFLLATTFITIPDLWMGGGRSGNVFHDNFGSIFLENFEKNYGWFFFFPLLYFVILFLSFSVFVWIYYRRDKTVGAVGFKNVILSLLVVFILIYFPIRIDSFSSKISLMKAEEISDGGIFKVFNISDRREFLNIYHSLYQEDLLTWRHDPILVAEHSLEYGILRAFDGEENELELKSISDMDPGVMGAATVLLKNEKGQFEIFLSSLGDDDNRVWMVYGYKQIKIK